MTNYVAAKDKGELAKRIAALRDRAYRNAMESEQDLSEYFDLNEAVAILEVRHEHEQKLDEELRRLREETGE